MNNRTPLDWRPTAEPTTLKIRAELLNKLRQFFQQRDVLEVETPVFTQSGSTEVHLDHFMTRLDLNKRSYALNTSPEFAMKRLLAAGYGDVFQVCKVFRANEVGKCHQPEFTMLEWYRLGYDLQQLMLEVEQLLNELIGHRLTQPAVTLSYAQAFATIVELDPFTASIDDLKTTYQQLSGTESPAMDEKQAYLDLIMSQMIEPRFEPNRLTFVTHYPAEQASLARLSQTDPRTAERFEVFAGGLELGNGFYELSDPAEQLQRMQAENQRRSKLGKPQVNIDSHFLAALQAGLPDCSGIALGFDRLVMLAANKESIDQVMSFTIDNC